MRGAGEVLVQPAEVLSEDLRRVQVKVRVTGAEALHAARLRRAGEVVANRRRQAESRASVTEPCAACGVALVGSQRAYLDPAMQVATGLPKWTVLCVRCRVALPAAVAAEVTDAGRTRAEGLVDLLWTAGGPQDAAEGPSRGEVDRQAVMARSARHRAS